MKKFHQQKKEVASTSQIIDSIFTTQKEQTELEVNLVSSRIILNKDQYTEYKKEMERKLMQPASAKTSPAPS